MGTNTDAPKDPVTKRMGRYADPNNSERFIEFAEDVLGVRPVGPQREILRAIAEEKYVLIQSGNGVGKTYGVGLGALGFLFAHLEAIVYATSGSYDTLADNLWKPMRDVYRQADLPGEDKESPPRIEDLPGRTSYFKARSPRHAGSLEGRHSSNILCIVDEADKPDVDMQTIDAMESNVSDSRDRMVVIGNPPDDETNLMYELRESGNYEVIQFSTFDSYNVQNELHESDDAFVGGISSLSKVRERWEKWNDEPWPGKAQAQMSYLRDDLSERWYRRVLGRIPPTGSATYRPIDPDAVSGAFEREPAQRVAGVHTTGGDELVRTETPQAIGIDVARAGGDRMAIAGTFGDVIEVMDVWSGVDHSQNEARIRDHLRNYATSPTIAIDANGEGSGLADNLARDLPNVIRYNAGQAAIDSKNYRYRWGEGLHHLGTFLASGAVSLGDGVGDATRRDLRDELMAAARTIDYDEKFIDSRSAEVAQASPKSDVKDRLGRSPDLLDACMIAAWARGTDGATVVSSTW